MSDQIPEIHVLLMQVETRFGSLSRPADFSHLSDEIENATSELLSPSTLKRLWGYVNYMSNPRLYTLDVLSRYIGYTDFGSTTDDTFCEWQDGHSCVLCGLAHKQDTCGLCRCAKSVFWAAGNALPSRS